MYSVLLIIHVLVTVFLIGIILMQNSASDGMGLSSSSSSSFLSGRAAASAITRTTAILAALFILTSLALGLITARSHTSELSIIDRLGGKAAPASTGPVTNSPTTLDAAPTTPSTPAVPVAPAKPSVPRPE